MGLKYFSAGNSIAPFSLNAITTNEFKWLPPESWASEGFEFFYKNRAFYPGSFLKPPPPFMKGFKNVKFYKGNWLLTFNEESTPMAWLEAHGFESTFTQVYLAVSPCGPRFSKGWADEQARESLSMLISGIFINSGADMIYLVGLNQAEEEINQLGWGTIQPGIQVLCNWEAASIDPLLETKVTAINAVEWWKLPEANAQRKDLAYLEKRRRNELGQKKTRPKRRGILSRLFRR